MYGRAIRLTVNKNVHQSTATVTVIKRIHPCFYLHSVSTQSNYKPHEQTDRNLVDEIRESASGMPPVSSSHSADHRRVNVVKTTTTPSYSTSERREKDDGGTKSYVVKAMETGLDIGETVIKTLGKVKEAVAGDEEKKYDVPPTDHFVDDLRKHAGGYDHPKRNIYNK